MDQQNSGWKNATAHNKEVLQLLVFSLRWFLYLPRSQSKINVLQLQEADVPK